MNVALNKVVTHGETYHFIIGTGYTPPQGLKIFFFAPSNARVLTNFLHPPPPPPTKTEGQNYLEGGGVIENSKKR